MEFANACTKKNRETRRPLTVPCLIRFALSEPSVNLTHPNRQELKMLKLGWSKNLTRCILLKPKGLEGMFFVDNQCGKQQPRNLYQKKSKCDNVLGAALKKPGTLRGWANKRNQSFNHALSICCLLQKIESMHETL